MANWNPNSTAVKGLEWFPRATGAVALDSTRKCAAMSMNTSVAGEAITSIGIANSGIPTRGGLYAVEVYDNETGVPVNDSGVLISPGSDFSVGGWTTQSGGTTNLWQTIDDPFLDVTDYIKTSNAVATTYRGRFNTGAVSLTGKRILSVSLNLVLQVGPTGALSAGLNLSGTDYLAFLSWPTGGQRTLSKTWYYNPATKKPWTIADITALGSTDEWYVSASVAAGAWSANIVYMAYLGVLYVDENRLAVGVLDDTASALGVGTPAQPVWNYATVTTPTGTTWTKDGSGRHLYTVRRINSTGSLNVPWLDAVDAAAPIGSGWNPTLDSTFGYITSMGNRLTRMHPVLPALAGPTPSVDGQPYIKISEAPVYLFQDAQQEFSNAAAAAYGVIRVMLKAGNADMAITCRRRSDNAQLGGTYVLTPAQVNAMPDVGNGWRMVQVQLPTAGTLATGTQYYLNFSAGVVTGAAWSVLAPDTGNVGNVATFGGTTDIATWTSVDVAYADLAATISTIPAAPSGFTAVLGAQTVAETVTCVDEIPRADLGWTATALGGSFLRYEIQRSEDGGTTWVDVATVGAEATVTWRDYEAPRGIAVTYRIRVVRTDLAFSAWSTSGTVTKPLQDNALYLVSNMAPTLNVAYDFQPARSYDFNENQERLTRAVYGRDYQLGFNPLEYRGTTANYTLWVGLDDKRPVGGGLGFSAFDPVRDIARTELPYVCVLDNQGNRLYAMLFVPSGDQDESGGSRGEYTTTITATEVSAVPYPVTA